MSTSLKKESSLILLANSITLTPGTLTVDIDSANGTLEVAVLTKREVGDIIPFERFIRGMME